MLQHPWLPVTDIGVIIASEQGSRRMLTKRRTPIPEKITFAGENTWKVGTKGVGVDRLTGWDLQVQHLGRSFRRMRRGRLQSGLTSVITFRRHSLIHRVR